MSEKVLGFKEKECLQRFPKGAGLEIIVVCKEDLVPVVSVEEIEKIEKSISNSRPSYNGAGECDSLDDAWEEGYNEAKDFIIILLCAVRKQLQVVRKK